MEKLLNKRSGVGEQLHPIEADAVLDDTMEACDVAYVYQRVGIEDDEVRELSSLNRALLRMTSQHSTRRILSYERVPDGCLAIEPQPLNRARKSATAYHDCVVLTGPRIT